MKRATLFWATFGIGAAVFGGVFGALELKDWQDTHRSTSFLSKTDNTLGGIRPVADEMTNAPAPAFDFRAAAKAVTASVVSIDRLERVDSYLSPQDGTVQRTGAGSGVILSSDGVIVTNNHVVAGAAEVKVHTTDGQTHEAKVLGRDPRSDLAVIKISGKNFKPVQLGDSNSIDVGEWVLAVGNPLGFDNTVSVGVVSSMKRSLPVGGGVLLDAIQTDAAINPGNSGGALTDAQGRLVGINSAIASSTGQSVGIGFAIPVNRVKEVVADIIKLGYARYAGLGISYNPNWSEILADPQVRSELSDITGAQDVPKAGIIIKSPMRGEPSVQPDGPAEKAGIREWDVLLAIDGEQVKDVISLNKILTPHKPGESVMVKYWSKGQTKTTKVTLTELHNRL